MDYTPTREYVMNNLHSFLDYNYVKTEKDEYVDIKWDKENKIVDDVMFNEIFLKQIVDEHYFSLLWIEKIKEYAKWDGSKKLYISIKSTNDNLTEYDDDDTSCRRVRFTYDKSKHKSIYKSICFEAQDGLILDFIVTKRGLVSKLILQDYCDDDDDEIPNEIYMRMFSVYNDKIDKINRC